MVTVLRTGSDRFEQVWTSQNTCEALFFLNRESHAVQIWPTPKPACSFPTMPCLKLHDRSGGNRASSRFNWRKVWTGVKCNFSWEHFQKRYIIRKLLLSQVQTWNFTSIGPKTKKLWLSIIPALRPSEHPGLGPPQKRCELQLFLARIRQAVRRLKALQLGRLVCSFSTIGQKIKNYSSFNFLAENLEKFHSTELYGAPLERSTIFLYCSSMGRMSLESCQSAE